MTQMFNYYFQCFSSVFLFLDKQKQQRNSCLSQNWDVVPYCGKLSTFFHKCLCDANTKLAASLAGGKVGEMFTESCDRLQWFSKVISKLVELLYDTWGKSM